MSARALSLAGFLAVAATLAGCGLHPLYATDDPHGGAQVLQSIYIEPIEGEIAGYELRNALIDGLHSPMKPADAAYRLSIQIKQTLQAISVQNNASITRYNYVLQGKYSLTDAYPSRVTWFSMNARISLGMEMFIVVMAVLTPCA